MKKSLILLSLLLATFGLQARAEFVAIACVESEEALKTYQAPYLFTAMYDTDGQATRYGLKDGELMMGGQKHLLTSVDSTSETTRTLYNGDIFRMSWPVTILKGRNVKDGNSVTARFYAERGSKNAMMGRVVVNEGTAVETEYKYCTSDLFY